MPINTTALPVVSARTTTEVNAADNNIPVAMHTLRLFKGAIPLRTKKSVTKPLHSIPAAPKIKGMEANIPVLVRFK